VVAPNAAATPTVASNKGCFLKSFKIEDEDFMRITNNAKNQVEKITVFGFEQPSDAVFTYNTDGTVSKINSDEIDYEFVYASGVLTKVNKKDGKTLIGERVITTASGNVTAIAYSEVEGNTKTLGYTHKFTYNKEGNLSKYVFNIEKVDINIFSDGV
jgi:hypothetical protein